MSRISIGPVTVYSYRDHRREDAPDQGPRYSGIWIGDWNREVMT